MKIIWELGDHAVIDDDMEAGPLAAEVVEIKAFLQDKKSAIVKCTNVLSDNYGREDIVDVGFLNAAYTA